MRSGLAHAQPQDERARTVNTGSALRTSRARHDVLSRGSSSARTTPYSCVPAVRQRVKDHPTRSNVQQYTGEVTRKACAARSSRGSTEKGGRGRAKRREGMRVTWAEKRGQWTGGRVERGEHRKQEQEQLIEVAHHTDLKRGAPGQRERHARLRSSATPSATRPETAQQAFYSVMGRGVGAEHRRT